ncbi:MAG TPA: alpha/beta fold hydrolase [Thermoguttaceae bacterium]|nr:alpha/beta fold hydrolase [Thermoguttaceae bacterium]
MASSDESRSSAWRELYPFESHYLTINGLRYHYLDEGRGPVVLMVHGNPTWSFYFRDLVLALRNRYRVIVPDHIGLGLSDKPALGEYSFRLARRCDDLRALVERLDLKDVSLVAHDWGGAIGMGAAVDAPERFKRFVLMNTAAFRSDHIPWKINLARIPVFNRVAVQGLNLFVRAATRLTVMHRERMTPAVRSGYLAPYDSWAHRLAVLQFVLDIPRTPRHPTYATLEKIERGLAQFAASPMCLIWGMRDWCFDARFLERFLDFFPEAEVHRLEDAGHYVVEDAHERIVPILERFLER